MIKILLTNSANTTALIARLDLGIVVLPHGAQKLFGWFGGSGFSGTMGFMTGTAGLPSNLYPKKINNHSTRKKGKKSFSSLWGGWKRSKGNGIKEGLCTVGSCVYAVSF